MIYFNIAHRNIHIEVIQRDIYDPIQECYVVLYKVSGVLYCTKQEIFDKQNKPMSERFINSVLPFLPKVDKDKT